jgi:hypothetical protein
MWSLLQKSLKIPMRLSESVYRRRTENTMAKITSTKGQTTIYNHTHKTKDRVTRTQLKTRDELRCSGRVSSSCSTSGTRRVNLVTNPVLSDEWGKDRAVSNDDNVWFEILVDALFLLFKSMWCCPQTYICVFFLIGSHCHCNFTLCYAYG